MDLGGDRNSRHPSPSHQLLTDLNTRSKIEFNVNF